MNSLSQTNNQLLHINSDLQIQVRYSKHKRQQTQNHPLAAEKNTLHFNFIEREKDKTTHTVEVAAGEEGGRSGLDSLLSYYGEKVRWIFNPEI